MAIYREGSIVGPISGAVGGVVFAQTRYGGVVRKRATTTDKSTPAQLVRRARFQQVVRGWSGLPDEGRAAWRAAAGRRTFANRLGVERYLTGFQLFVWLHMERVLSVILWEEPPANMTRIANATNLLLTASAAGAVEIDWVTTAPPTNTITMYRGVRTMSVRPRTVFRGWRYLDFVGHGVGAHHQDITSEWDAVLGHPQEGEVVAVGVTIYNTEYLNSFWVEASTVTVA